MHGTAPFQTILSLLTAHFVMKSLAQKLRVVKNNEED